MKITPVDRGDLARHTNEKQCLADGKSAFQRGEWPAFSGRDGRVQGKGEAGALKLEIMGYPNHPPVREMPGQKIKSVVIENFMIRRGALGLV